MEDFRSRSYGEGRTSDIQQYSAHRRSDGPDSFGVNGGNGMQDLRSYSTSYTDYPTRIQQEDPNPRKGRSSSSSWGFTDPDLQRKKRVVSYRAYTVEAFAVKDMEVLGMERLKNELQTRGLKCGGTLQERAGRLFLLKSTPLDKLSKKLLAKQ